MSFGTLTAGVVAVVRTQIASLASLQPATLQHRRGKPAKGNSRAAVVQWNHACFGVREVSKRTGSNLIHGPSVGWPPSLTRGNGILAGGLCNRRYPKKYLL
ncbi:hypothetical protein E2C01_096715 [Portunus trituberculatus]|uniref:Uncharacterized protein n=1 Tax=Portunus trituberculatus TaxID=210409 RepID=A0A5B7K3T6_PORTR|nr:hypothetical protein [Portunus trituberculatus]